jgi:hypothetical protein
MQYRTFGQVDYRPSALGFGIMRLPFRDGDTKKIDEPEATRMVRYAIDHGLNYVDTAWGYHGGESEPFTGRALKDGYRQRVRLATKLPTWLVKEPPDFDRFLNEQLKRLQTDHIDFYLLHELNAPVWKAMKEADVLRSGERALADGRIGHFGFSFHDEVSVLKQIIDEYPGWSFCQIQYNYMDEKFQAGTEGLKYAAGKGLGVVVMEPVRGGQLARRPPQPVLNLWAAAPVQRSPAEWALQWVWNHPEVSVVLSGMSTMEQVQENIASAGRSGPGTLTLEELAIIAKVRDTYRSLSVVACTRCNYCQPCPHGVNIPENLNTYNDAVMYNDLDMGRRAYKFFIKPENRADQCEECGECEDKCTQALPIRDLLKKVHETLKAE